MSFLIEDPNAGWVENIPEIQLDTPVLGGTGGPANAPHDALARRTQHLRKELEDLIRRFESAVGNFSVHDLTIRVEDLETETEAIRALLSALGNGSGAALEGLEEILADIAAIKEQLAGLSFEGGGPIGGPPMFIFANYCS